MTGKIIGIVCMILLPLSALLWRASHTSPTHRRYDVTLYKSLRIHLRDGVCGLNLISMPTKVAGRSGDYNKLNISLLPTKESLLLSSQQIGPYRDTWLVFPLWLTTLVFVVGSTIPLVSGPVVQLVRRWRGLCLECGYNLTGNRSGRCPECGTRFR